MTQAQALALGLEPWVDVCALDEILPDTAVCALVDGQQVAVVRSGAQLYAVDNFDPFSRAFVISRGIVGDRRGRPMIASPIYKHAFDLQTGACVDDPDVCLRVFAVRVLNGRVEVRERP
jgi:nitrite reductase (NADH) small subunit